MSVFVAGMTLFTAYMNGPFIKIRGKIYAFHVDDSRPDPTPDGATAPGVDSPDYDPAPDSYGTGVTAQKAWWMLILTAVILGWGAVVSFEDQRLMTFVGAVAFITLAVSLGYGDASWDYKIARGQRLQFAIIAIVTVGVFPLLYLPAYYAGKRWPLRREQSMEYRAHPRHQKR